MSETLALKYRPHNFSDVCDQKSIIKTLERQLMTNSFINCYLFCGPSGTGKTTIGRIFANEINKGQGHPIEIDAASNNSVDNIRQLIQDAKERSLDSIYKVYIIDETHMLTIQSWNALLKCIEEPPKYTIFIFCTTDPQKIPSTILNRVMRFNLSKISQPTILNRLKYVCEQEKYTNYEESIDYISKLCSGGMRDALALLDKCVGYSTDLKIENVLNVLGNFSYKMLFTLTNNIIDGDEKSVLLTIDSIYNSGNDLKLFIDKYLEFVLDLSKYCLFKDIKITKIPTSLENPKDKNDTECLKYVTGIENSRKYFNWLVDRILDVKNTIRYDTNIKDTISIMFLQITRGK